MSFFEDNLGRLFPVTRICRIVPGVKTSDHATTGRMTSTIALMDDGERVQISSFDIPLIRRLMAPRWAALPGYRLLTFGYAPGQDDPGPWIHNEPVIGWKADEYGGAEPVVIESEFDEMSERHAILDPTGGVYTPERNYQDQAEWVAEMTKKGDARAPSPQT